MPKLTYEDYCLIPQDGKIHEIINGEHYNHPAPRDKHQAISLNLDLIFGPYIRKKKLGIWRSAPYDVLLGQHDIVQPDKVFVSSKNKNIVTELHIEGVPDLIIEITSHDNPEYDRKIKFSLYEKYGIKHFWIVDIHADRLEVYEFRKGKYKLMKIYSYGEIFKPKIFPGLKVRIKDIFEI